MPNAKHKRTPLVSKLAEPLEFFPYNRNELCCESVPIKEIVKATGTPVYVYSAKAFLTKFREFRDGLEGLDHLICYAMKANSNIALLDLLRREGAGVDIVSGGELYRAGIAGISAEKIIFSGVGKTKREMMQALRFEGKGVFAFNVESEAELELLNETAAEQGVEKAKFALRFNPDVDAKTHPYISTGLRENKFGTHEDGILSIVEKMKSTPRRYGHIEMKGLSLHIGSQLISLSPLEDAFVRTKKLIGKVNKILKTPLSFVDLGGGLGIRYKDEKVPSISSYCLLVQKHFGSHASGVVSPLKIIIEPGRSVAGNSGVLVTEVLFRKNRGKKEFVMIDAAMNDLIRPALYESYHHIVAVKDKASRKNDDTTGQVKKVDVVGPICETGDTFCRDRELPIDLESGDLLAILSSGAYGFSMTSQYNSRTRASEVLVENSHFRIIRNRETFEDLIRGEAL